MPLPLSMCTSRNRNSGSLSCLPSTVSPPYSCSPTARYFAGTRSARRAHTSGEVVFNTAMTGYQEILTDPSYCRQIVTLTYPHIGNVGVNPEDAESNKVFAAGLVIRDLPIRASNFRMSQDLPGYLRDQNIPAIAGIDTRKLTRILRDKGAQKRLPDGRQGRRSLCASSRRALSPAWPAWTSRKWSVATSPINGISPSGRWAQGTGHRQRRNITSSPMTTA